MAPLPASVCHEHASLPSKSIFKQHFGRLANIFFFFFFSSGNFQNNLVLPSLFLWFEYWIINVLPALPHQAQHTIPRTSLSSPPPPPRLIVEDEETDNKYKDIILHGCDTQGKKGLRVITNKGQIIIPKWSRVQETTYWVSLTGLINFTASCLLSFFFFY